VAAIDFTNALARLLQDGRLRDQFSADPESFVGRLKLHESDHAALLALNVDDLECQAQVLLRKRLDAVRHVIPMTCQKLGDLMWPLFSKYARTWWPKETPVAAADAYDFCSYIKSVHSEDVNALEWNRLHFAFSRKFMAVHLPRRGAAWNKTALQILFRLGLRRWHEVLLSVRL
jgi:hypothetical protein